MANLRQTVAESGCFLAIGNYPLRFWLIRFSRFGEVGEKTIPLTVACLFKIFLFKAYLFNTKLNLWISSLVWQKFAELAPKNQ